MSRTDISAIIATRDRAAMLAHCLDCLCAQTLPPSRYDICVVDNGSTDNTREIVEAAVARHPRHRILYIYEPVPGVPRAHNRGLAATDSDFVIFPDDDVRVPPTWLENFLGHFERQGDKLAVVGGDVMPIWCGKRPAWVSEDMLVFLSATTGLGHLPRFTTYEECFIEYNCCFRRKSLAAVGNFPEHLGRIGNILTGGQNAVEAAIKLRGGRALYDPAIIIRHIIHADRLTPTWLRRRFFWQGATGQAVRRYLQRMGGGAAPEALLNLPLAREDWAFADEETLDGFDMSLHHFQSLGFVLALTGIIPVGEKAGGA
ncbi:MAG: glycosyltransferase [Alphaproteobacteria bacterium]|nr:glycosyltransferase [Alphaproteobacteria bacterium]